MASWTDLPQDIGHLILDKLPELLEHVRFGVVCKYWYDISREYQQIYSHFRRTLPMLLLPSPDAPDKPEPPRLYALSCQGQYYQNLGCHHLPFSRFRFCGSSNGWLATQNEDFTFTLSYPFGSELLTIHLPYLRADCPIKHDFHIRKLIVSPESTSENYKIVVIFGDFNQVATIKSGEESWVVLLDLHKCLDDIIFFENKVYGVSCFFTIVMVDIEARPLCSKIIYPKHRTLVFANTYLVESSTSELFVLGRDYYQVINEESEHVHVVDGHVNDDDGDDGVGDDDGDDGVGDADGDDSDGDGDDDEYEYEMPPYKTVMWTEKFYVFKLKLDKSSENVLEMVETNDLGGDAFFIGDSESISFPTRRGFFTGCKPDSIYFTDDEIAIANYEPNGPEDVGCYNVVDQSVDRFYTMNPFHKKDMPQPIWIVPKYHKI